jgi:hypothetical protein
MVPKAPLTERRVGSSAPTRTAWVHWTPSGSTTHAADSRRHLARVCYRGRPQASVVPARIGQSGDIRVDPRSRAHVLHRRAGEALEGWRRRRWRGSPGTSEMPARQASGVGTPSRPPTPPWPWATTGCPQRCSTSWSPGPRCPLRRWCGWSRRGGCWRWRGVQASGSRTRAQVPRRRRPSAR